MSADQEARLFLDRLRAQTRVELGTPPAVVDLIASRLPDYQRNPGQWATLEDRMTTWLDGVYDKYIEQIADAQRDVEQTAASTMMSLDLGQRPLVAHLRTGHIHAVTKLAQADFGDTAERESAPLRNRLAAIARSTRLLRQSDPGRLPFRTWLSEVRKQAAQVRPRQPYLILVEDQLPLFVEQFGSVVARAIPRYPASDSAGRKGFMFDIPHVTQRIETHPEVADLFAEVVVAYAVRASLSVDFNVVHKTPEEYTSFAAALQTTLRYFVLSHEYAHIVLGHLERTAPSRTVAPVVDPDALKFSWQQELEADSIGMMIALNTAVGPAANLNHPMAFLGMCLYLEAMDVMDRAVAVLETGDENLRQIGSHPPAYRRKRGVRGTLSMMIDAGGDSVEYPAEEMRNALAIEEVQAAAIRLLWERARPVLLDLRRRGARAAPMWRVVWKDADEKPAPVWMPGPEPVEPKPAEPNSTPAPVLTTFLVTEVWDLPSRDGLMVSGKTVTGKVRSGMTLRNDAGHTARVLALEFLSPRDIANGEVTIMVERTVPTPVRKEALLTVVPVG